MSSLIFSALGWDQVNYLYIIIISVLFLLLFIPVINIFLKYFLVAGVTVILPTEIFNQTARPAAYMISGSLMWLNLFVVGMVFPFLVVRV